MEFLPFGIPPEVYKQQKYKPKFLVSYDLDSTVSDRNYKTHWQIMPFSLKQQSHNLHSKVHE